METMLFTVTLVQAKQGNREALAAICEEYQPRIYDHVQYRVPIDAIDAVVSDIFISIIESIHTVRATDQRGLTAWIKHISDTKIADYYRAHTRTTDPLDKANPITWDDPALHVETEERNTIIHKAVDMLSTDMHKVVTGRIIDDLPVRKVAESVGKSPSAVRQITVRGLAKLRRILTPLLVFIIAVSILVISGAATIYFTSRATPQNAGYPARQAVFPTAQPTTTQAPTIVPTFAPMPTARPLPSPTPTPSPEPPTAIPVQSQSVEQPETSTKRSESVCVIATCVKSPLP